MKTRWIGTAVVALVAAGIVGYKLDRPRTAARPVASPHAAAAAKTEVVLVANLREANDPGDHCAEIIHLVREAGARGIPIRQLSANSDSPLIRRYHVLTVPTLLVLDRGNVVSRYEGESSATVRQIRARLATLHGAEAGAGPREAR